MTAIFHVGDAVASHPAKFNDSVLEVIAGYLATEKWVLDPFAGVGRIHNLYPTFNTIGIEIEPEWANQHPRTMVGDALNLLFPDASFDAIATSPCYGNRMADHHQATDDSTRITYRHTLGRPLHPNNAGQFQWGEQYWAFHVRAWRQVTRVLKPGGRFVLNVSNHIRNGKEIDVATWHIAALCGLGMELIDECKVNTQRMRFGANRDLRTKGEYVVLLRKWDA